MCSIETHFLSYKPPQPANVHASAADNATVGTPSTTLFVMDFIIYITPLHVAITIRNSLEQRSRSLLRTVIVSDKESFSKHSAAHKARKQGSQRPKQPIARWLQVTKTGPTLISS